MSTAKHVPSTSGPGAPLDPSNNPPTLCEIPHTRRSALLAVAGTALAAVPAAAGVDVRGADVFVDPAADLVRRWLASEAEIDRLHILWDETEDRAAYAAMKAEQKRQAKIDAAIVATPATTWEGIALKGQLVAIGMTAGTRELDREIAESLLADVERLSGSGAHV